MGVLSAQINLFNRVPAAERLLFTKHLATMISAGIPITEALETLVAQGKSVFFKGVIVGVLEDVKNGKSLASAMKRHPKAFSEFYVSLIEVAEEVGKLDENLNFLAKQLAKDYSLRKKIRGALMYPSIVVAATVVMGIFVSLYVLPNLVDFFQSFQIELPLPTKILVVVSTVMKSYGVLIFAGLGGLSVGFLLLTRSRFFKPIWHSALIKFPIVGQLLAYGQLAAFSRNLGTLIKSGVAATRSLEITANTMTNVRFRKDLMEIAEELSRGKNIAESMSKPKYSEFPPIVSRMIGVGEKTGKLDETLLYLSSFYEDEVDDISKNLGTIIEPILLIVIGLVVGFVALSIISPIYQLTGSIRR